MDIVKACSKHVDYCVGITQSHDIGHKDMDHISRLSTSTFGTISYIYSENYIWCWLFLTWHNQLNYYLMDTHICTCIHKRSWIFICSSNDIMCKMSLPIWFYPNDFFYTPKKWQNQWVFCLVDVGQVLWVNNRSTGM